MPEAKVSDRQMNMKVFNRAPGHEGGLQIFRFSRAAPEPASSSPQAEGTSLHVRVSQGTKDTVDAGAFFDAIARQAPQRRS